MESCGTGQVHEELAQSLSEPLQNALKPLLAEVESVSEHIWNDSPAFNCFRDESWMPEPCRSCERRTRDFGGCRCQAFLLTGDAAATDPVCTLGPAHGLIEETLQRVNVPRDDSRDRNWVYRIDPS